MEMFLKIMCSASLSAHKRGTIKKNDHWAGLIFRFSLLRIGLFMGKKNVHGMGRSKALDRAEVFSNQAEGTL